MADETIQKSGGISGLLPTLSDHTYKSLNNKMIGTCLKEHSFERVKAML